MTTTSVTIRMDKDLKAQAEAVFADMGMNMTTALTIFIRTVVRQGKIPFTVCGDPFYSPANQAALRESIAQLDAGDFVVKTLDELIAMEDA
jgi:DNA-damage-inducible protein J